MVIDPPGQYFVEIYDIKKIHYIKEKIEVFQTNG